ncbi:hypothetical protein V1527DRAFT_474887 [Lipomyces starkeyi]
MDAKRNDGSFKDTHNYIVNAPSITGPWSEPVFVNSSGFDLRCSMMMMAASGSSI